MKMMKIFIDWSSFSRFCFRKIRKKKRTKINSSIDREEVRLVQSVIREETTKLDGFFCGVVKKKSNREDREKKGFFGWLKNRF